VGFTHNHNRYYCKFGLSVTEQTPQLSVSWRVVNLIPDFFFDAGDFWFLISHSLWACVTL
jgi:hypothetical protein